MRSLASVALAVALASQLAGQIVVVDPGGGGQYRTIQAALNATRSGVILRVKGGVHGPLTVRHSVTIIGDPTPRIRAEQWHSGKSGKQPAAITLIGNGKDRLDLVNVEVADTPSWGWNEQGEGIAGRGFALIRIERSIITAMKWGQITGDAISTPGISTPDAAVLLSESIVRANDAVTDIPDSLGRRLDGATGIVAAELTAIRSQVHGGKGADLWFNTQPQSTPCYCSMIGSNGGDAAKISGAIFATPNALHGGVGGKIRVKSSDWGQQHAGNAANKPATVVQDNGTSSTAPAIKAAWTVRFPALRSGGILALGAPMSRPIPLGNDWLFVDPKSFVAVGLARNAAQWAVAVPNSNALVGIEVAGHVADLFTQRMSTPILRKIGF